MKHVLKVPVVNANDEFVVLVRWHIADGAQVKTGAPLVDVETTKAVVTIESEQTGWLRHVAKENTEVPIGAPLAIVVSEESELAGAKVDEVSKPVAVATSPSVPTAKAENVAPAAIALGNAADFTRLSPQAEKLATELGVAREVWAQANLGLITAAQLRSLLAQTAAPVPKEKEALATPALRSEKAPLSKRAEIDALTAGAEGGLRSSLTVYFDSAGLRGGDEQASVLPLVLAATAKLLPSRPRFTAYFDSGQIRFYDAVHLGVAMDQGEGLRVVTVRSADKLAVDAIAGRLGELALDYAAHQLRTEDVSDATFTVTDLSAFDVLHFEPLMNGRQSAILALGGDSTLPGHPMSLTLAFDHRVLTGREVAEFLKALRDVLLAQATIPAAPEAPTACCDRCFIDVASYYDKFGKFGLMLNTTRPDGSTGMICHSCRELS